LIETAEVGKNVYVEAGAQRLVANKYIPAIFPGEPEKFSFMVSPSKLKNEKFAVSLNADNAVFSTERTPGEPEEPGQSEQNDSGGGGWLFAPAATSGLIKLYTSLKKIRIIYSARIRAFSRRRRNFFVCFAYCLGAPK
jgi:hypothetical protein